MQHGFIKAAAITPKVRVADVDYNKEQIIQGMYDASAAGAKILVFPELAVTGYTCGDLFLQRRLLDKAQEALAEIVDASNNVDGIIFLGTLWVENGKLYNVMVAMNRGEILGVIPKISLPNYAEFYEKRYFEQGNRKVMEVKFTGREGHVHRIPFGTDLLFQCEEMKELVLAAEICEDVWAPNPPSVRHALAGATVIVNASASDEAAGKDTYRGRLVIGQSARLICGYVYASAGEGESSTDLVFGGHNLIAENGTMLTQSTRFQNEITCGDLDVSKLTGERRRNMSFGPMENDGYERIGFTLYETETKLERYPSEAPFVPGDKADWQQRCEEILSIQASGLKKRLEHTGSKNAVIGISGGLDSTLALLVMVKAFDWLGLPRSGIHAVTMPCFGTTDRTYRNACVMTETVGAALREIPIQDSVRRHFNDIGHDESIHDVTYENAQARERTQVLMDIANQINALVVGTGDMSELALGWTTYNGDHMSMYGVNAGVPKTLVRHLVRYYAETCGDEKLSGALFDVLDTPVSPELLPPESGEISQRTEELVGPYELHDYFLYYMLRYGFEPAKIYRLAKGSFEGAYEPGVILRWMKIFYARFFSQQFKRSCLPDGPKVGSVAVSPRGDLRMPSDACSRIWLQQLEELAP